MTLAAGADAQIEKPSSLDEAIKGLLEWVNESRFDDGFGVAELVDLLSGMDPVLRLLQSKGACVSWLQFFNALRMRCGDMDEGVVVRAPYIRDAVKEVADVVLALLQSNLKA